MIDDVLEVPTPVPYPLQELPLEEDIEALFEATTNKKTPDVLVMMPSTLTISRHIKEVFAPVSFMGRTYLYDPETSLYYEDNGTVKQWVQQLLIKAQDTFSKTANKRLPPTQKWESTLRDVNTQVGSMNTVKGNTFPFNMYNGFPCDNCVVTFNEDKKIELEAYCCEMMYTRKIPVKFNPKANKEAVVEVLKSWMPGTGENGEELYRWLLQIPAQAVIQSFPKMSPFKKAYLLIGKPNAGKSAYTDLLQLFFGEKNSSTFMLHEFSDNFIVAELPGRFYNGGDDLPFIKIEASNKFKTLTGKRNMMVNPKFGKPYEASITAVQTFSANYPPELASTLIKDEGWWDRWNILMFGGTFPKNPMWESETFTDEFLEGFLLLVLEEVERIMENGNHLCLEQPVETVKGSWTCNLKLFHQFIDAYVEKTSDDEHYISKEDMMDSLTAWGFSIEHSKENGIETYADALEVLPIKSMKALTNALALEGIYPRQILKDGSRPYFNVKWRASALNQKFIKHDHSV